MATSQDIDIDMLDGDPFIHCARSIKVAGGGVQEIKTKYVIRKKKIKEGAQMKWRCVIW